MLTYVGEGRFTSDDMNTFGCRGVAQVPGLQKLLKHICRRGFEHHVAASLSRTADVLHESFETYLGWDVYHHARDDDD